MSSGKTPKNLTSGAEKSEFLIKLAADPAYAPMFDAFAPEAVRGGPIAAVQEGDINTFGSADALAMLAAGRCVVQFNDKPTPPVEPDMTQYETGTVIHSNTGQLAWDSAHNGCFTIDTDGTKAVVGFGAGRTYQLGQVMITPQTPYASIILTAMEKGATLANAKSALLTAIARTESTGFTYNTLNGRMMSPGTSPLLVEPVQADIAISGRGIAAVNVLSQNGALTGTTLPVRNGTIHLDTGKDKTMYYQVVFQ